MLMLFLCFLALGGLPTHQDYKPQNWEIASESSNFDNVISKSKIWKKSPEINKQLDQHTIHFIRLRTLLSFVINLKQVTPKWDQEPIIGLKRPLKPLWFSHFLCNFIKQFLVVFPRDNLGLIPGSGMWSVDLGVLLLWLCQVFREVRWTGLRSMLINQDDQARV